MGGWEEVEPSAHRPHDVHRDVLKAKAGLGLLLTCFFPVLIFPWRCRGGPSQCLISPRDMQHDLKVFLEIGIQHPLGPGWLAPN